VFLLVILVDSEAREPKRKGKSIDLNGAYLIKGEMAAKWRYAVFDFVSTLGAISIAGIPRAIASSPSL
jgi:hypothetical protein